MGKKPDAPAAPRRDAFHPKPERRKERESETLAVLNAMTEMEDVEGFIPNALEASDLPAGCDTEKNAYWVVADDSPRRRAYFPVRSIEHSQHHPNIAKEYFDKDGFVRIGNDILMYLPRTTYNKTKEHQQFSNYHKSSSQALGNEKKLFDRGKATIGITTSLDAEASEGRRREIANLPEAPHPLGPGIKE